MPNGITGTACAAASATTNGHVVGALAEHHHLGRRDAGRSTRRGRAARARPRPWSSARRSAARRAPSIAAGTGARGRARWQIVRCVHRRAPKQRPCDSRHSMPAAPLARRALQVRQEPMVAASTSTRIKGRFSAPAAAREHSCVDHAASAKPSAAGRLGDGQQLVGEQAPCRSARAGTQLQARRTPGRATRVRPRRSARRRRAAMTSPPPGSTTIT